MKKVFTITILLMVIYTALAVQTITKLQAGAFTSVADITDSEIKLVDANWTAAQFTALITATKGNLMLTSVDMSEINIISNNTLNATSMFEGCTQLKTVIMFTTSARASGHVFTKTFLNCTNLEGTVDLSAFPQFGSCSYAFQNCAKLGSVRFASVAAFPTSSTYIFNGVNANLTVYIPATGWDSFSSTYPSLTFIKNPINGLDENATLGGFFITYDKDKAIIHNAESKNLIVADILGRLLFNGVVKSNRFEISTSMYIIAKSQL